MKLKYFYFTIILIIYNSIVQACQEIILDYVESTPSPCITYKPVITFNNYQYYSTFSISPTPISIVTTLNNKIVKLDYSIDYTLTYSEGEGCTIKTKQFTYTTPTTPLHSTYIVTQPKCIYSTTVIKLQNSVSGSTYKVSSGTTDYPLTSTVDLEIPQQSSNQLIITDTSSTSQYPECSEEIPVGGSAIGYPDITIVSPMCLSNNNGTIVVSGVYTSISLALASSPNTPITSSPSLGSFNSLAAGNYLLTCVSSNCGKQIIPITLQSVMPQLKFNMLDSPCPSKPKIQVSIEDPSILMSDEFTMTIDGIQSVDNVLQPIIKKGVSSLPFTFSFKTCSASYQLPITQPIMNIQYSISNEINSLVTCDDATAGKSLSLVYDKTSVTDLSVSIENSDGNQTITSDLSEPIPIDSSKEVSVVSACYQNPLYLQLPTPEPILNVDGGIDGITCFENTTITIYNHLDFSSITLSTLDNPSIDIPFNKVSGQFSNIYRKSYKLSSKYCSNSIVSTRIVNLSSTPSNYKLEQTSNQIDCLSGENSLTGTFYRNDGSSFNQIINYIPNQSNTPFTSTSNNCIIDNLVFNNFNNSNLVYLNLNNKPIIKINKAKCLYSHDGSIEITSSNIVISTVIIGDKLFRKSVNNIYGGLSVGSYNVKIVYGTDTSNKYCGGLIYDIGIINIDTDNSQFTVTSKIVNVTSCNTNSNDGSITIENVSTFKSILIDSSNVNQVSTGVFSNLESGMHDVKFSNLDESCSGSIPIFVPSTLNPVITMNVAKKPTCYSDPLVGGSVSKVDGDGILSIGLFDSSSGIPITITQITDINSDSNVYSSTSIKNNAIPITSGNKEILIHSNSCVWKKSIAVPSSDHGISYKPTLDYNCITNFENGLISSSNLNDVIINSDTVISNPSGQFIQLVKWNSICQIALPIITGNKPISKTPTWSIESVVPTIDCTNTIDGYNLKITNLNEFSDISINNQRPNSNGYYTRFPLSTSVGNVMTYIDKSTQCKNTLPFQITQDQLSSATTSTSLNGISKVLETCHGSSNGVLELSKTDQTNYYFNSIINRQSGQDSKLYLLPLNKTASTNSVLNFIGISSTTMLSIIQVQKTNPLCTHVKSVSFQSSEPTLVDLTGQVCLLYNNEYDSIVYLNSTDPITNVSTIYPQYKQIGSGSTDGGSTARGSIENGVQFLSDTDGKLVPLPNDLSVVYKLINIQNPTVEIPISDGGSQGDYLNLEFGDYQLQASISNKICKRSITKDIKLSPPANGTSNDFLVKVDTVNFCEKVRIVPNNLIDAYFNYYIKSDNGTLIYSLLNQTGLVMSDYLDSSMVYTLSAEQLSNGGTVVTVKNSCDIVIQSKVCPTENSSQIKLIVGLALGLLVAAFIITYGIYKLRQRHLAKKNKGQIQHDQEDDDKEPEDDSEYRHHNNIMMGEM